jgi:hypothetical protein
MVKDPAFLVLHDYGMGGSWWWSRASSAEEITDAFAEVEVISDPETIARVRAWDLDELDIEDARRGKLASFHETRLRQRQDPAFGRLFARTVSTFACPTPKDRAPSG